MIIGNNKEVKKIYKNETRIIDIAKGNTSIFSQGSVIESLLTLPAKINAVTKKILDLKLYGNTEQETTTGKNKLDLSGLTTRTAKGITITPVYENGKLKHIAITGTPTGTSWNGMKNITLPAGTYTLSGINVSDVSKAGLKFMLNASGSQVTCGADNKSPTFTISESKTYEFVIWVQNVSLFPTTPVYLTPQVESGNTASSYEPFTNGASPNPDYPEDVETITGTQEISINSESYTINLGSMELCKINDYKDYIYKSNGTWYKHKVISKISSYNGETITNNYISTTGSLTTGATIYYILETPVEEEITDTTLISQLEAISLVNGENNISSSSTNLEISEIFIKYRGE